MKFPPPRNCSAEWTWKAPWSPPTALHTQTETARIIVQERGADYLFTVKGNQKGIAHNVQQRYRSLAHAFSPSS